MDLSSDKQVEETASSTITDVNAGKEEGKEGVEEKAPVCEKCGQPSERKKRGDNTWYLYPLCRKCRKEAPSKEEKPEEPEGGILRDEKLNHLLFDLYHRIVELKSRQWEGCSQTALLQRIRMIKDLIEEEWILS